MRLCWRVLACRACVIVYMYIDIVIGLRSWRSRVVLFCSVCCSLFRSCRLALLSVAVAIWCNRATMRRNRFYVLGSIVFYLVRCRAIVARFTSAYRVFGVACAGLLLWRDGGTACALYSCSFCWLLSCWREDGAYWLYVCRYIFIYCCCWRGLWRVLVLVWWCCTLVAGGLCVWIYARFVSCWCGVTVSMYICMRITRLWWCSVVWCARV